MAYAFNDDKGKYDLDENVLGGATTTLYDADIAIANNTANIGSLQTKVTNLQNLVALQYKSFSNVRITSGNTGWLASIPSGYLMVGQVLQGTDCGYINVVQDQAGGVYATNCHHTNTITISGKIYYRKI